MPDAIEVGHRVEICEGRFAGTVGTISRIVDADRVALVPDKRPVEMTGDEIVIAGCKLAQRS